MARRAAVSVVALLVGLVGALLVVGSLSGGDPPPAVSTRPQSRSAATRPQPSPSASATNHGHGTADLTTGLVLPASPPVTLAIPRMRVAAHLVRLGVDASGAMEVPRDPAQPGWYDLGPTPGSLGPAVIAGHVTWNGARSVFFDLARLRAGDRVRVVRRDGTVAVFAVRGVARFAKTHFPTRRIFGSLEHAGLRLITCGGTYDAGAHRYLANVVVFADLVDSHRVR